MTTNVATRNIALCVTLNALWAIHLSIAVTTLFYESHGLTQTVIFQLVIVASVAALLFEIPAGFLSDKFGDRQSIVVGVTGQIIGCTGLGWWADAPLEFALCHALIGLSWSMSSGSDRSIINKTASAEQARKYSFYATQSRAFGGLVGVGIGSLLVSYGDITLPFKVQPISYALAFFAALALKETHSHKTHAHIGQVKLVCQQIFTTHPRLRWMVLLAALVNASALALMWMAQPDLEAAGVGVQWFGAVFVVRSVMTIIFGFAKDRFAHALGPLRTQATLVLIVGSSAWFAALSPHWTGTVAILAANAIAAAFTDALLTNAVNEQLASIKYASTTVYSVINALQALVFVPISLGLGPISDNVSPALALMVISAVTVLPGWHLLRQYRKAL